MIARTGREIREVMEELAEKGKSLISDLKIYDEEIVWQDLDPAIISRALHILSGKVKVEWII
ncbi:MAG: hypothetical protein QW372_02370 [Nitrososphaerales archaeon]